jgi:hypothetical protein
VVIMPGYGQHRSKRLWGEDPDEWKAERWDEFAEKDSLRQILAGNEICV